MSSLTEELLELEKKLVDPELRSTPERLAPLLADDFIEFGSGGHAYDKKRVLFVLKRLAPAEIFIEEFRVINVCDSAALVTYRACTESSRASTSRYSLRSSLWVLRDGGWQMHVSSGDECSRVRVMHWSGLSFYRSGGRDFLSPRFSMISATLSTTSSSHGRAMICTPMGRPSDDCVTGTVTAGIPKRLNHSQ